MFCVGIVLVMTLSHLTITVEAATVASISDNSVIGVDIGPAEDSLLSPIKHWPNWRHMSELRPWNFMAFSGSYMVSKGVPLNTIYLILILPVIASIVAFSRQVIGFKALGIYTPSIIAVLFLALGLKYGLAIFLITLLIGTLGRLLGRKVRLAYLPKMAIVITLVGLGIFAMFLLGSMLGKNGLVGISIFPILIMVLLTEKFITVQVEQGNKRAIMLIGETMFLSIVCYLLANWSPLKNFILYYPEIILLTIVFNLLVGRWTGLRLMEYYRFRKVIQNVQLDQEK